MKCCIVRDLLPGYLEELTSEETSEEVRKHLKGCRKCRTVYEQMAAEIQGEMLPEQKEVDFLKKLRTRIRQRYAFGAFLICAFTIGVTGFLKAYDLPAAFDPERMTVEVFQSVYTPNDYGLMVWTSAGSLEPEETEAASRGDYDSRDEIRLVLQEGLGSYDCTSIGRTLKRDGGTVRIVYYCYTRSLWDTLFDPENSRINSYSVNSGRIYEANFFRTSLENYEPMTREIYYLPMGNMNRLSFTSDEEFDALREEAVLVWRGEI